MTVKELIELLSKYPPDALIIYQTREECLEPYPMMTRWSFKTSYYDGHDFKDIPANTEFVSL